MMKRLPLLIALALAAALVASASASAATVQLGQTTTPVAAPACPKGVALNNCKIVLEHTTAVQSVSDGTVNPTRVSHAGWIVSFTVGLSNIVSDAATKHKVLHTLDSAYGGTPQVALTVLKPGPRNTYTVAAQSGSYHLIPFLGQVLQEPLSLPPTFRTFTALPVAPGDVIALTVPTWAPVLTYQLDASRFSYRQSRRLNCQHSAGTQTAQTKVGAVAPYLCSYTGTRVEYSATEVTNQPYPRTYVH